MTNTKINVDHIHNPDTKNRLMYILNKQIVNGQVTPAKPRSPPEPFPEAPFHQPTRKVPPKTNPEKPPDQARNTDPALP